MLDEISDAIFCYGRAMTYNVAVVREVSASPEKVWSLVTDLPRMGEWAPENLGGEWLDGATCAAVGAKFRGNNKNGDKSWQATLDPSQEE